ncbi:MAG: hypothetical protein FRX48_00923 [Lasallia pustulata]|uniref:DUF1776-domain-containing protein n=1 Tax=Lasallia pustulata TaxID=136370 RepID=A0A5M8Q4U9_9LECA|nr:MAG: hypothetical protein FRX48_00923 [Lasallia pustulata]
MSSDDQYFLDILSSIPNDVRHYSLEIAESIDRHFESVASSLRETLQTASWLPNSVKPAAPPPPQRFVPPVQLGYLDRAQAWVSQHRAVTAAVIAFVGTGTFILWRRKKSYQKKRRARRAANGARTEVVVVAGSPHSPLTRSIALDLERRGFIVYIPVSTFSEEQLVQAESRADIHPLHLDITSPSATQETISRLSAHLSPPQQPRTSNPQQALRLSGLLLLPPPPSTIPTGPLLALSASTWSDILNTQLLAPLATLHAFLPLLTASPLSKVLLLTPSIIPSLKPAFHAPESVAVAALSAYAHTLRAEVGTQGVHVHHFKLGNFDYSSVPGFPKSQFLRPRGLALRADVLSWDAQTRAQYAQEYVAQQAHLAGVSGHHVKGSSLRELHNGVFDVLAGRDRRETVWVGRGGRIYDLVGTWMPSGLVGWMLGLQVERKVAVRAGEVGEGSGEWEEVEAAS